MKKVTYKCYFVIWVSRSLVLLKPWHQEGGNRIGENECLEKRMIERICMVGPIKERTTWQIYRVSDKKIEQRKSALVWYKLKLIANETYINVTNEVLAFECRLFQPIWMLQSGDIAIFPREVKEPIVPLFVNVIQSLRRTLICLLI